MASCNNVGGYFQIWKAASKLLKNDVQFHIHNFSLLNPYPTRKSGEHGVKVVKWCIGKGKCTLAYTSNILLANVAGNARHTLIHCLYIVYTLHVVRVLPALIADITHYISMYYLLLACMERVISRNYLHFTCTLPHHICSVVGLGLITKRLNRSVNDPCYSTRTIHNDIVIPAWLILFAKLVKPYSD